MSRTNNAINGFIADLGGQLLLQLLNFIVTPFLLLYTTSLSYGYWLTIGSVMLWIAISDLGIGMALTRSLIRIHNKFIGEQGKIESEKLVSTAFWIFIICAFLYLCIALTIMPLFEIWFKIAETDLPTFKYTYILSAIAGAISMPLAIFSGILESSQKLTLNRNIATISGVINVILSITLVIIFRNIVGLALALLFTVLLRALIGFHYANKEIYMNFFSFNFSKQYAKILLSYGGFFQLGRLANTVALNTDNILISTYLGSSMVPGYNFSAKFSQLVGVTLSSKIPVSVFSGMSELLDKQNFIKLNVVFRRIFFLSLRIAAFFAPFAYYFNQNFVTLWIGEVNYLGDRLNLIFVYWIVFETIFRSTTAIIMVYGDMKLWSLISVLEAIMNVLLSLLLVKPFGLLGIAFGTALSRTITTGPYMLYYFFNKGFFDKSYIISIVGLLIKSIPSVIFMAFINFYFKPETWLSLFLTGATASLINILFFDGVKIYQGRNRGIKHILHSILNDSV